MDSGVPMRNPSTYEDQNTLIEQSVAELKIFHLPEFRTYMGPVIIQSQYCTVVGK